MTLAYAPHVTHVEPSRYPPERNQRPIIILMVMKPFSRPFVLGSIVEIIAKVVATIVLRIVIVVLVRAMVIIIMISRFLFIISTITIAYISSA